MIFIGLGFNNLLSFALHGIIKASEIYNMSSSARLTPRQADAQDRRRRMTQQRQVLSNRIRKQKKSEYLARKRNLLPSASRGNEDILGNTESVVDQFRPLVDKFCSNQCTGSLRALHDALERKSLTATEEN